MLVRVGRRRVLRCRTNRMPPMEMRGRIMTGYVRVAPEGYRTAAGLKRWVTRATDFVPTLPAKAKKVRKKQRSGAQE